MVLMVLLSLEPRNRPHAADLLGVKPKPVARLNLIEGKTVQNVKVHDRTGRGPALLQLNPNLAVGTIDFGDQPKEKLVGKRSRAQASYKNRPRQKHSNRTHDRSAPCENINSLRNHCPGKQ
jgi:hypothetical protein